MIRAAVRFRADLVGLMMTLDPARAALAVMALLVVPLRLWTVAGFDADNPIYRLYPWWLQVATLAAFMVLWTTAMSLSRCAMRRACALAFVTSVTVAASTAAAALQSGAWIWWLAMSGALGWALYRLSIPPHVCEERAGMWTPGN